ncbi:MAG: adenylate/guanylate cyclase domain-containing protein, partial [Actinobacteria bacterium]
MRRTPAARNERRQVTVLHSGITLDSELDPEALHRELARFSDRFAAIVERHGGTVERSSAESAVGFFGLATTHEDDVLRALRAALELGVTAGIDSGELFVGEEFASGRPLSRARRLHETAADGAILLSSDVHRLVEQVAVAEPAGDAWQLVDLRPEQPVPLHTGPFVGRSF